MPAYLNAIATAVPDHDVHAVFIRWAVSRIADPRERRLFERMTARSGIAHRWSVLPADAGSPIDPGGFYADGATVPTSARMALYADAAPVLAERAARGLGERLDGVTHLVVASCTGFVAPGIDQLLAGRLKLNPGIERTLIGFMGCYAAVTALKTARHIVRSEPGARVLVVTVELSTLHLQPDSEVEPLLAMLQFGDGAAAAIVSADAEGLALGETFALNLSDSASLISWTIGDTGFAMRLSGEVPARIADALTDAATANAITGGETVDTWTVHAGGRSILDAVEAGFALAPEALEASRAVLRDNGNMSSATLMFVLARQIARPCRHGVALAFGPGLAAEGFRFASA